MKSLKKLALFCLLCTVLSFALALSLEMGGLSTLQQAQAAEDPWDMSDVKQNDIQVLSERPLSWSDMDWKGHFSAHWHNRLVHFPIVLICAATVLALASSRGSEPPAVVEQSGRWRVIQSLVWGAAVLAWLAVLTGQNQVHGMGVKMAFFAQVHQILGVLTTLAAGALAALGAQWGMRYRRWQTLGLCLLTLFILLTAAFGGILAAS